LLQYDRVAEEYVKRIFEELAHKPLDRALLDRFAEQMRGLGPACDVGCGPGQVARYLHDFCRMFAQFPGGIPFLSRKINLFALRGDISAIIASPLAYEIESSGVGNSVRVIFRTDNGIPPMIADRR
jgi:hypothetical protein